MTRLDGCDLEPVRRWLSFCASNETHEFCNVEPLKVQNLPGVVFRLIDLKRRCIVAADTGVSYVTLTYVWGGVQQLQLQSDTKAVLTRDGGLDELYPMISTTVRDAMAVCEKLNERYLWTDGLCIIRDSAREMKVQISWMRQIYSTAKCGIAAVSAETADTGFLGGPAPTHHTPSTDAELADLITASPWSARAWCYQERVLSRRLILFTSAGIFMQCQDSLYSIDGTKLARESTQAVRDYDSCGAMLSLRSGEDPLELYLRAVEHYSWRRLTKPEDKVDAFEGILQRYQRGLMDPGKFFTFHHGLPLDAFDQTFCWRPLLHDLTYRNNAFPSWSWFDWNNAASFDQATLQGPRTNRMLYSDHEQGEESCSSGKVVSERAKSANSDPVPPEDMANARFGFPIAQPINTGDRPALRIQASVARLLIDSEPTASNGSQGCYAVLPTRCSQQPLPPPPKLVTLREIIHQPIPPMNLMDKGTAEAPSIPAARSLDEQYNGTEHSQHDKCGAHTPIGFIWLHENWRQSQPRICTMEFMALSGKKDNERPGAWTITMLMLLQRMEKNRLFWARERLQVMDCDIKQHHWLEIRAETISLKLV